MHGLRAISRAATAMALAVAAFSGCERDQDPHRQVHPASAPQPLRIVSLSPAISRTLLAFDLGQNIVGRTPHCHSLDQSIPVVGDLLNVDYEQLVRLNPTHLLVQPPVTGLNPHLQALADEHQWKLAQWRLNDREDIEDMVRELPATLYEDGTVQLTECSGRAAQLLNDMASAVSPGTSPIYRGRTLIVSAVEPVMVFGDGTYLDDVVQSLGGTNAVSAKGWARLSLEDVTQINPDAIIIVLEPAKSAPPDAFQAAGPLADLNIAAVADQRIAVLAHPDAFTPSIGLIDVANELREILRRFAEDKA